MLSSSTSSSFQQNSSYSTPIPTDSPALPSEEQQASQSQSSTMAAAESVDVVAAPIMKKKHEKSSKVKIRFFKKNNGKRWFGIFPRIGGSQIVAQPRYIPYPEEIKIIRFRDLIIKNLISDTANFYLPRRHTSEIEFIGFERFNGITIPEINTENCMSKCFHDPVKVQDPDSPGTSDPAAFLEAEENRRGKTHEFFQNLQAESSGHLADPTILGGASENNYPEHIEYLRTFCDAYDVLYFPDSDCHLCVVTDGCGPGQDSRDAAQIAVAVCIRHIRDRLSRGQTLESLIRVAIRGMKDAQKHLIVKPNRPKATTININLTFTSSTGEKYLLVIGLGDTKCYLTYFQDNKQIPVTMDLSQNGRPGDGVANSGGALGGFFPYPLRSENYIYPNLGNLSVICCQLPRTRTHYVSTMTDGLTDCLDPQLQQLELKAACSLDLDFVKWENLEPPLRQKVGVKFSTERFSTLFLRAISQSGGNLDRLCGIFMQYTKANTMGARAWISANPKRLLKHDAPFVWGKMDHVAMTCYRVPSNGGSSTPYSSSSHTPFIQAGSSSSV